MKNRTFLKTANLILNLIFLAILASGTLHFFIKKDLIFGQEFAISYVDGFIKRGFTGTLLFAFTSAFDLDANLVIKDFIIFLMIINLALMGILFFIKKLDFYILLSSFLVLNIYAQHIAFRLDLLLIPLLFVQMYILHHENWLPKTKIFTTSFLLILGILIHEVYFLIAIFTFTYLLYFKLNIRKPIHYTVVLLPSTLLFFLMSFVFKGSPEQINNILISWQKFGLPPEKLDYLKWLFSLDSPIFIWQNAAFIKNKFYLIGFFLNYLLVIAVFYCYVKHFFSLDKNKLRFFLLGNALIILFLCFIATDFIRWYYLIFLCILFYFIVFEKKINHKIDYKYLALKFSTIFIGLPMYGWTPTHFYWTSPFKYLLDLKDYF